ncbi:lysosome-associated membrane glycoprotein 1-like [Glandiceps talaboti]
MKLLNFAAVFLVYKASLITVSIAQTENVPTTLNPIEKTTAMTTLTPTTSAPTSPSPSPTETDGPGYWTIKDSNGETCLLAQMSLRFYITYTRYGGFKDSLFVDLPKSANSSGSECGNDTSILELSFFEDSWVVTLVYQKGTVDEELKNNKYYLREFSLDYVIDGRFQHAVNPGEVLLATRAENDMATTIGHSYKCDQRYHIIIDENVTVNAMDFQIQPFALDTAGQYGKAELCGGDVVRYYWIPIAVCVSVIGAVLVVGMAYYANVRYRKRRPYSTV